MKIMEHMSGSEEAFTQVALGRVDPTLTIEPAVARCIAGWWATPAEQAGMTQLSMGMEVSTDDVLESIERAYSDETLSTVDRHALEALKDFVLHHAGFPVAREPEQRVPYAELAAMLPDWCQ